MDKPKDIPLGHVISSHQVLGWCGYCRGHSHVEELEAWRCMPDISKAIQRHRDREKSDLED